MKTSTMVTIGIIVIIAAVSTYALYDFNGNSLDLSDRQILLIVTDSMDGNVTQYDVDSFPKDTFIMIEHLSDEKKQNIQIGDVLSFWKNDILIHHRVTETHLDQGFVMTHGDNTTASEKVLLSDINGKVIGTNHLAGQIVSFIKNNILAVIALIAAFTIIGEICRAYRNGVFDRESNTKSRKTALAASIAVVIILFAGVGYAIAEYESAGTTNNAVRVAYITITQLDDHEGGVTKYRFSDNTLIEVDTENSVDAATKYYKVRHGSTLTDGNTQYCAAKVGSVILHAEHSGDDTPPATLTVSIESSTDFNGNENWMYFIVDSNKNIVAYSSEADVWTSGSANLIFNYSQNAHSYNDIDVDVYYGYPMSKATKIIGNDSYLVPTGDADIRAPKQLVNASITFSASDE